MKRAIQYSLLLVVLGSAAFTARADAVGDYKVILDRNPFGLKPTPVPAPPPAPAPPPETPTNYKLSGITALFNPPRAMFVNQPPGKPTPEYLSLSEGQVQGSLEVLPNGINVKAGTVRVKISGEERTLSFEKDGLKAPAGPPVMTAPGVPLPGFGLTPNPAPATPGGTFVMPPNSAVPLYSPPPAGIPKPAENPAIPSPMILPGSPTRQIRTSFNTPETQPAFPPVAVMTPEAQTVGIEITRAATAAEVANRRMPPLPPTLLSPPTPTP